MATVHGKQTIVLLNGVVMTTFLNEASAPTASQDTADTSTFSDSAKTYVPGLTDATFSLSGLFDGATDATDQVFQSTIGDTDDNLVVLYDGDTLNNTGWAMEGNSTSYEITAPVADVVSVSLALQSSTAAERIRVLHPLGAVTVTGTTSELDNSAGTTNGGSCFLQVTAASGTTPTLDIDVEHSTTSGSGFTTLGSFTTATAAKSFERIEFTGTVNQFVRASFTITGTTPSFTMFLGFNRE